MIECVLLDKCSTVLPCVPGVTRWWQPHMRGVVEYMLQASSDPDPLVALEATEFW